MIVKGDKETQKLAKVAVKKVDCAVAKEAAVHKRAVCGCQVMASLTLGHPASCSQVATCTASGRAEGSKADSRSPLMPLIQDRNLNNGCFSCSYNMPKRFHLLKQASRPLSYSHGLKSG